MQSFKSQKSNNNEEKNNLGLNRFYPCLWKGLKFDCCTLTCNENLDLQKENLKNSIQLKFHRFFNTSDLRKKDVESKCGS